MEQLVLTLPETARVLRISRAQAFALARDGRLPVVQLSPRVRRVPLDALRQQLAAAAEPPLRPETA